MSETINAAPTRVGPAGFVDDLLAAIQRKPLTAFALFVIGRAVLWTILPAILSNSLPLDVIEGVAYGRDWQLGYWKHPPLPWLLVDITHQIFGGRIWAFFMLGQLSAIVASWAIWRLGCEIFTRLEAFVAVVVLDGYIDFNLNPGVFNHNVLQIPIFALAGWSLYRAFVGGALRDWLLVGLWFAMAFYTKYEVIVLLAPLLVFSVVDPRAQRSWRTPGPYAAAALCAALIAPQMIWLAFVSHFSAIKFADDKAPIAHSPLDLLAANAVFIVNALAYIVPVVILFRVMAGRIVRARPAPPEPADGFARRYLVVLAIGPLATAVGIGLLLGRQLQAGWSEQLWVFTSLFLMAIWRPATDRAALRRLLIGWCALTGVLVAISVAAGVFLVAPASLFDMQFPGKQFSALVTRTWRDDVGPQPLPYIVGEFWSAGNVILFSPERPRQFEEGDLTKSPRIDPADVRRRGAVILFPARAALNAPPPAATTAPWLAEFPTAQPQAPFIIRQKTPRAEIDWTIGWALLRPEKAAG